MRCVSDEVVLATEQYFIVIRNYSTTFKSTSLGLVCQRRLFSAQFMNLNVLRIVARI
jgi:hypothetical protein